MIDHPRATVAAFVAALVAIIVAPDVALAVELAAVPIVVVAALVSTGYLWRIYQRNPIGVIWRQLISSQITTAPLVVWVGYLTTARIADELGHVVIPIPPPGTSSPITGLLLILAITPSIRYAIAVRRLGRSATEHRPMGHLE